MIVIIDAYNVLKQVIPHDYISLSERNRFIAQLAVYKKEKKHSLVVVFDGGPHTWPVKERIKTVEVIYSGMSETADHFIKRFIQDNAEKSILLVSSDGELVRRASDHGVPSMGSTDFYRLVQEAVYQKKVQKKDQKTPVIKTGSSKNKELDALMRQAAVEVEQKKEDIVVSKPKKTSNRLKKSERALLRKVNKL